MANGTDPFAFLSKTKVSRETVASLEASNGKAPPTDDPFSFLLRGPSLGFREEPVKDIGIGESFAHGLAGGIVSPLRIFRGADEVDPRISEPSEKIANVLGSFVGVGISFIPFSAGTGVLLRGAGLARPLVAGSPLYKFVRGTLAGTAQFAGTSESLEDVPKNIAVGAAFGAAVEGLFLAKAMRVRAGSVIEAGPGAGQVAADQVQKEIAVTPTEAQSAGRVFHEIESVFYPPEGRPGGLVRGTASVTRKPELNEKQISFYRQAIASLDTQIERSEGRVRLELTKQRDKMIEDLRVRSTPVTEEIPVIQEVVPTGRPQTVRSNVPVERIDPVIYPREELKIGPAVASTIDRKRWISQGTVEEIENLAPEILLPEEMSLDRALVQLTKEHNTASRIVNTKDPELLLSYIKQELPGAQVLSNGDEILVHNPTSPEDLLTPKQVAQYHATGFPEGMEVNYTNAAGTKAYRVTGGVAAEGRVQLQGLGDAKGLVFAPKISQVTRIVNPRFITESSIKRSIYEQAVEESERTIGFAVGVENGVARRGVADTTGYQVVESLEAFVRKNGAAISATGGKDLDESVRMYATQKGIKGLLIQDGGITTKVVPFEQGSVSWLKEGSKSVKTKQGEIRGAVYATNSANGQVGVISKNTIPGEKPWRFSVIDRDGEPITHRTYDSFAEAELDNAKVSSKFGGTKMPAWTETSRMIVPAEQASVPSFGIDLDQAVMGVGPAGEPILQSFSPSWKNSLIGVLKQRGIPEKDLAHYLDLHEAALQKKLLNLPDSEFKTMRRTSNGLWTEGCL